MEQNEEEWDREKRGEDKPGKRQGKVYSVYCMSKSTRRSAGKEEEDWGREKDEEGMEEGCSFLRGSCSVLVSYYSYAVAHVFVFRCTVDFSGLTVVGVELHLVASHLSSAFQRGPLHHVQLVFVQTHFALAFGPEKFGLAACGVRFRVRADGVASCLRREEGKEEEGVGSSKRRKGG